MYTKKVYESFAPFQTVSPIVGDCLDWVLSQVILFPGTMPLPETISPWLFLTVPLTSVTKQAIDELMILNVRSWTVSD